MAEQDALVWRSLEAIRPDDRKVLVEAFRIDIAGKHPVLGQIMAEPEGAWCLENAACQLVEARRGADAQREKATADLVRRLESRVEQIREDLSRARQIDQLYRGVMSRLPTNLTDDAPFHAENAIRELATALEGIEAALASAEAHHQSKSTVSVAAPEQEFAKALAILFVTQGHDAQGDKSGDRFKEALRLAFDACKVAISGAQLQAAYVAGSEFGKGLVNRNSSEAED